MTAAQMPGQTLEPIPANSGGSSDDVLSLLRKCVENSYNWAAAGGQTGQHADWLDDQFALYSKLARNISLVS